MSGAASKLFLLFPIIGLVFACLPVQISAEVINKTGQVIDIPYYLIERPIPGWKFKTKPSVNPADYEANRWQIAPNNAVYKLGPQEFAKVEEGRLLVEVNNKFGYVDLKGVLVIPAVFADAKSFSAGYALVRRDKNGPLEVVNKSGVTVDKLPANVKPRKHEAWNNWDGVAGDGLLDVDVIGKDGSSVHQLYSIKRKCVVSMPTDFQVELFYDGMAAIELNHDANLISNKVPPYFGFIDSKGQIVIPPKLTERTQFGDGLAPIRSENRWYYIDHHGHRKLTMPENCAYALPFYEGLAAVAFHQEAGLTGADVVRGDRWAFIDNTGAVVIPPKFHAGNGMKPYFSNGLCCMVPADAPLHYFGYIDRSGRWAIPPKFETAGTFEGEFAMATPGASEFSKARWLDLQMNQHQRVKLFELFLATHKLIGMPEKELVAYLGEGDSHLKNMYGYLLTGGHMGLHVDVMVKDGIVTSYRYNSMPSDEWYDAEHADRGDSQFWKLF